MDAKILETVNFSVANLNAYLQARGTQARVGSARPRRGPI